MSEPDATPPPQPTHEDITAIMERATAAAERAENAAQVQEQARVGAEREVRSRWPEMPPEMIKAIADASAKTVVATLRREFELAQQPPAASAEPAPEAPEAPRPSFAQGFLR